ncbi:MAG: sigma-70 family RNA polymerase sigma factor [Deltaproteobacteria bacterium]|nr:MAG: sigma-70 family RNA polymerase sigma factor [Deltaproteobacteria bacterium]
MDEIYKADWGRLLSGLIRAVGDFDVAEEALQDAFAAAVTEWAANAPRNPRAWLYGTARHKAIDKLRRRARLSAMAAALSADEEAAAPALADDSAVPDERLRLIFTCCHPALAPEAQVALTLRTLCGLTTEEIARAFLVPPATMAQRLVRAKSKIRAAGIPYQVPSFEELPARASMVMAVVYLVFNEGYSAAQGDALIRHDLCAEAIRLARLLRALPPVPVRELDALLALMLLHDARRDARTDAEGEMVPLAEQDRTRWNRTQIEEGIALVKDALRHAPAGPYALEAAIAAVHAEASRAQDTDWRQIALLYERLHSLHPSPVVALNRAVAVAMADGPAAALPLVDALADELGSYHLWHATRADLLHRLGRREEAIAAWKRAHELATNDAERRFLTRRIQGTSLT